MKLTSVFTQVLQMSLTGSTVILVVYLARLLLRKAPKIWSYALWALVLIRLLCPFSLTSDFSILPDRITSGEVVAGWSDDYVGEAEFHHNNTPSFDAAVEAGRQPISAEEGGHYVVMAPDGISEPDIVENTVLPNLAVLWLAGIAVMVLYSLVSYRNVRKQVRVSVPFRGNIYLADDVTSPFVMGFFRPKIYLPGTLTPQERQYIIHHECHHIRRGDHIFKALGFLALTIHWFNPLVWLAFVLSTRDMEMSCDEAVIRRLGETVRAEYSATLLNLSTGRRIISGTPLAFGEGDPKGRIQNLANWRKPKFWVILVCVVLCILLAVCLLTNPKQEAASTATPESYFTLHQKHLIDSGSVSEVQSEWKVQKIAIAFVSTSGPRDFAVELQYQGEADTAWTVLEPQQLRLTQDVCVFEVPAPCEYKISATATAGQSGYANFEIASQGVYALADVDKTTLEQIALKNCHNGAVSYITGESDLSKICAYLDGLYGVEAGSGKGYYEGSYELTLYFRYGSEQYQILFGDSDCFYLGQGEDGYPIRYELLGAKWEHVVSNLDPYDVSFYQWPFEASEVATQPAYQNLSVSLQTHEVTPEHLVLTYHNESEDPIWRLPGYSIQQWQNGQWVELDVGATWYETTEEVDFNHLSNPQNGMFLQWDEIGTLPNGQYRIGQEFCTDGDLTKGQRFTVYAPFEITAESGGIKPLEELPEVYSGEQAIIDGCIVMMDGDVRGNQILWDDFLESVDTGKEAFVRIAEYQHHPNSRTLSQQVYDISFDGSVFTVRGLLNGERFEKEYQHLLYFTGDASNESMNYDSYVRYVLSNEKYETWEEVNGITIGGSIASPRLPQVVYSDLIYSTKHPNLPDNPHYAILGFMESGLVTVLDGERLEKIIELFENGEYLGFEPKTHSVGVGLELDINYNEGDFIIELDPDQDVCRINGEFVCYGAPDEPDSVYKLWEYLGITQWPDIVYMSCENALRP